MSTSVILTCYNHAAHLPAALRSLTNQTVPNLRIVIVNDCASDGTDEILHSFQANHPRNLDVNIIRTPANVGQAAAINLAMEHLQTNYAMILNDDDYLMHDAVEAAQFIIAKTHTALFGGACTVFDGPWLSNHHGPWLIREMMAYEAIELQFKGPQEIDMCNERSVAMTHSGMTVSKEAWRQVGGYRRRSDRLVPWADRDFQLRVAAQLGCVMATGMSFAFWRSDSSVDQGRFT